jgi:lipoprotein-releasing system permease protein
VQKSREIGILRAVGTSTGRIMRIFLMQGALAGLVGSLLGCLIGAGLSLFFQTMATDVEGRPIFPVDLNTTRFVLASVIATVVGLAAAVAPARRAAQLDPAQVIRYG